MGSVSVCAEQYRHKFFLSHQPNRTHNLHIPPRKLLQVSDASPAGEESSSPMQKFLPYNDGEEESDGGDESDNFDPYSADYFRMYEFKVRRCTRSRSHDWTDCPFAHPGEKARRRDPRRYSYSGTICSEFRRGGCNRGDSCEFSHGVFETWLHPSRYRTEACKDGRNCKRKVCFFAHTPRQLRILPPQSCESEKKEGDLVNGGDLYGSNHCCRHCHCHSTRSPTSTLMNVSRLSSPISPSSPPISRTMMGYKNAMSELVGPLEAINISVDSPRNPRSFASWLDFPSFNGGEEQLQQQQFVLSPSPPSNSGSKEMDSSIVDEKLGGSNNGGLACPDLEWVNELLM